MNTEQYQRTINSIDKEIANLEKRKAAADKKYADERKRATNVSINKNDSELTIRNKTIEKQRHESYANKALEESADLQKKIAYKQEKRNETYIKLQKEQQNERKKEQIEQQKTISNIQRMYEEKITALEKQHIPNNILLPTKTETNAQYDVFVSHAWEDKESFVDEFVNELINMGAKVWYDKNKITWGDSMRAKIDEGLRNSRFGVVILSPDYIAEHKYWTKAELDGLFQMESVNGKTILPIWHHLSKQDVQNYSPIIANRLAMNTSSMTAHEIAEKLIELIPSEVEEENNEQNEIRDPESDK